jgi:alpha-1,6-mannosyltransferase
MFWGPASGGVRRYILAKRAYCAAHTGLRHSLVVPGARNARRDEGVLTMHTVPALPMGKGYRFPLRTQPWIDALIELKPDVIEAGDPYRLAWAAIRAGRLLDVPVVGFFHSDLTRMTALRFGGWTRAPIKRYIQHLYGHMDWVFAPSQIMTERLHGLGLARVSTQPLGVDTDLFTPLRRDDALRARLKIPADARLLVYAGRNAIEKNLNVLFDAVRHLGAPYHLLLIGPDMPRPTDIAHTVVNFVADPLILAGMLASCDALVHAGDQETFGLVIAEGMAAGLPVIGVNSGAVPELVDESVGALARPNDAIAFAVAIDSVFARNPRALGATARARVVATFGWPARFAQMIDDMRQLRSCGEIRAASIPVVTDQSTDAVMETH